VGGGRACKFFLELLQTGYFKYLDINLLGVCDINSQAEGLQLARQMGVYTTDNFKEFFNFKNLDSIIELTNSRDVLLKLVKLRPKGVGIMEYNIGQFLRSFFDLDQQLKSAEYRANLQTGFSDFLIQQSDAAIVLLNTDFTISQANDAYLKIVEKTKEEVLGAHCYEIYYGLKVPCSSSLPIMQCPMLETMRTGKTAHVVHEFSGMKDRTYYSNIVTYPLRNQDGDIFQVMEIIRDITEAISSSWEEHIKKMKADLNKIIQEDRMISLGKLVASCVHEINNPIQGLLTFSDLMKEILSDGIPTSEDMQKFKHFVSLMSNELERCGNIVSGLLSFSREMPIEYKSIDLNDVLESVIKLIRHKMELQNIQLVKNISPGLIMIKGDANRLQQTLLNLIFNAIEAMPEGGQLDIVSKVNQANKEVLIEVQDTGCGIPEEHIDHIYDPFFTTKEEGKGTGLGLSIVYGVVTNHGGKIHVKSVRHEGTTFSLIFPLLE
jgi:signal transduction histidine kinase